MIIHFHRISILGVFLLLHTKNEQHRNLGMVVWTKITCKWSSFSHNFVFFYLRLDVGVHGNASNCYAGSDSGLRWYLVTCTKFKLTVGIIITRSIDLRIILQNHMYYLPKITMEKPMTKTRFRTFPTAWVRGATLSKVLVAIFESKIQNSVSLIHF